MQNGIILKQFDHELDLLCRKTVEGLFSVWEIVRRKQIQEANPPGLLHYAASRECFVVPWI
jgi:hypothetical protein